MVKGNYFTGFDDTYLDLFTVTPPNYALFLFDGSDTDSSEVLVEGNRFDFGRYAGTTYGYDRVISTSCSATIVHNIIKGINASGYGLYLDRDVASSTKRYLAQGNKIYRGSTTITNYVRLPLLGSNHEGMVVDNYFDSTTNGTDTTLVNTIPDNWVVTRNKNQTFTQLISCDVGEKILQGNFIPAASSSLASSIGLDSSTSPDFNILRCNYQDTGALVRFRWVIPLLGILPEGVYLTDLDFVYNDTNPDGSDTLSWSHTDSANTSATGSITLSSLGDQSVPADLSSAARIRSVEA